MQHCHSHCFSIPHHPWSTESDYLDQTTSVQQENSPDDTRRYQSRAAMGFQKYVLCSFKWKWCPFRSNLLSLFLSRYQQVYCIFSVILFVFAVKSQAKFSFAIAIFLLWRTTFTQRWETMPYLNISTNLSGPKFLRNQITFGVKSNQNYSRRWYWNFKGFWQPVHNVLRYRASTILFWLRSQNTTNPHNPQVTLEQIHHNHTVWLHTVCTASLPFHVSVEFCFEE